MARVTLRKIMWLFLAALIGLAGWMGVTYATGPRAWRNWKAAREAKGETFRWSELAPPPIPDDQNAAMHPAIQSSMVGREASPLMKRLDLGKDRVPPLNAWISGKKAVLPDPRSEEGRWLTEALAARTSEFHELAAAISRPDFRIPVAYGEGEAPSLLGFRAGLRALNARALLRLRDGDHAGAAADAMVGLRLSFHLRREPSLLAHLLAISMAQASIQVVWEGLVDHAWTEGELANFEAHYAQVDLLGSGHRAYLGERMFGVVLFEAMAEGRSVPKGFQGKGGEDSRRMPWYGKPWVYQNLLEMDRYYTTCVIDAIDPTRHRIFPLLANQATDWPSNLRRKPHLVLARIAVPNMLPQVINLAVAQTRMDFLRVACALERHRMARGFLPETLDALSPTWLDAVPCDVTTGGPLHYQRKGQTFQLYAVGWDLVDQGGSVANAPNEDGLPGSGDWVWFPEVHP